MPDWLPRMEKPSGRSAGQKILHSFGCDASKDVQVQRGISIDVWFAVDDEQQLWYNIAPINNSPPLRPARSKGVGYTLKRLKKDGYKIVTVGVCDTVMIGLGDEV